MKQGYDVVIVGSGFGGSVSAHRLATAQAAAGRPASVCVLERGKRYNRGEFPRDLARPKDWWWRNGGRKGWKGLFDFRMYQHAGALVGAGVGGTSLVYLDVQIPAFGSTFKFRDMETGDLRWPMPFTGAMQEEWDSHLQPYYQRVDAMLRPTPIPAPTLKTRALQAASEGIGEGTRFRLVDLAIYWGKNGGSERGVLRNDPYGRNGPPQAGCRYCGECYIGCNTHSKNTLDLNYLWLAQLAGAEVYPEHNVLQIQKNGPDHPLHPDGYTVHFEDVRWGGFRSAVSAQILVLSAGTLGSTELLLRARHGYRRGKERFRATLPALSPKLGHYFSGNGDYGAMAAETNREVNPMTGPVITATLDYNDKLGGHGFLIEDGGFPDFLRAYLRRMPGGLFWGRRMLRVLRDLFGRDENRKLVEGIFSQLDFETLRDALPFLVMGIDAANGVLRLDDEGCVLIDWNHEKTMPFLRELESTLRKLTETLHPGLDGNLISAPTWGLYKNLVTVHPLGGCPMGETIDRGVVDSYGKVFGYENLYVLDGSILPSAIGPNPSKTIAALTERGVERIVQRHYPETAGASSGAGAGQSAPPVVGTR